MCFLDTLIPYFILFLNAQYSLIQKWQDWFQAIMAMGYEDFWVANNIGSLFYFILFLNALYTLIQK